MAASIDEFLQTAALLYERVSKPENFVDGIIGTSEEAVRLIRKFEEIVSRLAARPAAVELPADAKPLRDLTKACWKVSQDVLLRLKGVRDVASQEPTTASPYGPLTLAAWPPGDVELFAFRVSELRSQWNVLKSSHSVTPADISESLARLNVFAVREGQTASESHNAGAAKGEMPAPRHGPNGILNDFILESISFKSMRNREEEVADAHGSTFDWIFNPKGADAKNNLGDHYMKWLGGDEMGSIYWVTGKPGSGKSTLMRYISEHPKTTQLLESWAGKSRLARANFYFWASGSEEQRSQTGLLRYLLHQLLSDDTDSIARVFPHLWEKLSTMSARERIRLSLEWNAQALMDGFSRYLKYALPTKKICLFVDGLDEFDGDHNIVIHFFRDLAEGPYNGRIKLCLSSRPWEVFEKAFQNSVPNLKLQDLTFQDMFAYVHDNLRKGRQLRKLLDKDQPNYDLLTRQIVHQADGVFLWIRLVVLRVLENFNNPAATISEVQAHVHALPTDLNELFDTLLFRSQSAEEIVESSHIFQLVLAREIVAEFIKNESENTLTLWELGFALHAEDDDSALHGQVEEVSDEEIVQRCRSTERHAITRSAGLLEVYAKRERGNAIRAARFEDDIGRMARKLAGNRVTYLHRTVRDYLMLLPGVWERLKSVSSTDFDPHLRLLRSYVLRLKHSLEEIEHHRRLDEWYPDVALSLTHARYATLDASGLQTRLINELDSTLGWYWLTRPGNEYDHWARACFGSYEQRRGNKMIITKPFLLLCTKFGLERYITDTLDDLVARGESPIPEDDDDSDDDSNVLVEEMPLLAFALEFLTSRQKTIFPLSSPSFVSSLLRSPHRDHPLVGAFVGASNTPYDSPLNKQKNITPWHRVLRHLRDAKRRRWIEAFDVNPDGTERWTAIVRMLIETGSADMKAVLEQDKWDPEASALDVLVGPEQLGTVDDWWIKELGDYVKGQSTDN